MHYKEEKKHDKKDKKDKCDDREEIKEVVNEEIKVEEVSPKIEEEKRVESIEEKDIKEITLYENGEYATIFITSPGGVKQNYKTSIDISELVI